MKITNYKEILDGWGIYGPMLVASHTCKGNKRVYEEEEEWFCCACKKRAPKAVADVYRLIQVDEDLDARKQWGKGGNLAGG